MTNYVKSEVPKSEIRMECDSINLGEDASRISEGKFWDFEITQPEALHEEVIKALPPYDLNERTAQFGEQIIRFAKKIPRSPVNDRLINQLVGSGTSVGANYCEAEDSVSRKDFKNRIGTSRKESKETKYWLRMIAVAEPDLKPEARSLWKEANELNLIFGAIWRKP